MLSRQPTSNTYVSPLLILFRAFLRRSLSYVVWSFNAPPTKPKPGSIYRRALVDGAAPSPGNFAANGLFTVLEQAAGKKMSMLHWGELRKTNGDWQFPWSEKPDGNQPGDYVKMWRHVHDIFNQEGTKNVTWVWCPNITSDETTLM